MPQGGMRMNPSEASNTVAFGAKRVVIRVAVAIIKANRVNTESGHGI